VDVHLSNKLLDPTVKRLLPNLKLKYGDGEESIPIQIYEYVTGTTLNISNSIERVDFYDNDYTTSACVMVDKFTTTKNGEKCYKCTWDETRTDRFEKSVPIK
jgi:hypothetical protein